jgi:hypothetical protein
VSRPLRDASVNATDFGDILEILGFASSNRCWKSQLDFGQREGDSA